MRFSLNGVLLKLSSQLWRWRLWDKGQGHCDLKGIPEIRTLNSISLSLLLTPCLPVCLSFSRFVWIPRWACHHLYFTSFPYVPRQWYLSISCLSPIQTWACWNAGPRQQANKKWLEKTKRSWEGKLFSLFSAWPMLVFHALLCPFGLFGFPLVLLLKHTLTNARTNIVMG